MNRFFKYFIAFSIAQVLNPSFLTASAFHHEIPEKIFDFIIVGGGTAGCVLARRLAENGEYSVLLVEEGGLPHPDMAVPRFTVNFRNNATLVEQYISTIQSIPQVGALNRRIAYQWGKVLGGSSSVNMMAFNRGSPLDFNNWANLTGDQSWSYWGMLKYFKKSENYLGLYPSLLRGIGGPVTITPSSFAPGLKEWLSAGQELGYLIEDPNSYQTVSFTPIEFNKNELGRRVSSFEGYLRPILNELSNLVILINSKVTEVIFDKNKNAVGVEIHSPDNSNEKFIVKCKKEIILSAGAVGSPSILQRSEIKGLPIGKNLQDHVLIYQVIIYNDTNAVLLSSRDETEENYGLFNRTGQGPYSNPNGNDGQAFISSSGTHSLDLPWPNILIQPAQRAIPASAPFGYSLPPDELKNGEVRVTWGVFLTQPKSRGYLTTSESGALQLDLGLISDPDDLQSLVEAMKFTVKLCEDTKALQSIGCRLPKTPMPYCQQFSYHSDDYWRCYIRQAAGSGLHGGGTNRMGHRNDPRAVVDPELKVIGINGLRVCDASIMPTVVNASPQAAIYAIAEKGAELILKEYSNLNYYNLTTN